jgi:broad specificity phosphatase PhoE
MPTISDNGIRPSPQPGERDHMRVYLVRHGETPWSLTGQHTGRTDVALTAHGEDQARALAPALGAIDFDRVLTSPALRARQTCELAGFADEAVVVADLAEWDYGDYEGKSSSEIRKQRPGWNVYRDGCPGGESVLDVTVRADRVIASFRALSGTILVFSHGQFGCSLAARWIDLAVLQAQHLQMDPASVGVLAFNPAHPAVAVIAYWNGTTAASAHQAEVPRRTTHA